MEKVKHGKKVYPIVTSTDCGDDHKNRSKGTYMELWRSHFGPASHAAISRDLSEIISFADDDRLVYASNQAKIYLSALSASYATQCETDLAHAKTERERRESGSASVGFTRAALNIQCLNARYAIDDLAAQVCMSETLKALRPYDTDKGRSYPPLPSKTDLLQAKTQKEVELCNLELQAAEAAEAEEAAASAIEEAWADSKRAPKGSRHMAKETERASEDSNGKGKYKKYLAGW